MNKNEGHDLIKVLNLSPRQVSAALGLFYVAYIVFDFPSNLLMCKLNPRVWMTRIVFATGFVGAALSWTNGFSSLAVTRFVLGVVIAGMWPGMALYLTLFYPPERTGKRIGMYFTAGQVSAIVVGLSSAGFQLMDGIRGIVGFRWMFLIYGLAAILLSFILLWWLPDRPLVPGQERERSRWLKWLPPTPEALNGRDAVVHYRNLSSTYHPSHWTIKEAVKICLDWRLYPLWLMYFGVVGVGIGTQLYGSVIIRAIRPQATDIQVSLLFAPIWLMDLIAILIVTPLSDRFHHHRALFFSGAVCIQILGLLTTTFAPAGGWARYGGLLMVGFGLGPTVPICMAWTTEVFQRRHGELGVAAATALVSGYGNLGSLLTSMGLYTGWEEDRASSRPFRRSNLVMVAILAMSLASAVLMTVLLRIFGSPSSRKRNEGEPGEPATGGIAEGETRQRGFKGKLSVWRASRWP